MNARELPGMTDAKDDDFVVVPASPPIEDNVVDDFVVVAADNIPELNEQALNPITSCIRFCFKRPIITLVSIIPAAAGSLYSLTFASGDLPQNIGADWWSALSAGNKAFSVINALVSLIIFMMTNMKYLPPAAEKLRENLRECRTSLSGFLQTSLTLLLGLSVGLIYGTQAFNAFFWAHWALSALSGLTNFLSYAARRYSSILSLIDKIRDLLDSDHRFQQAWVEQLAQLKPEYREEFNALFRDKPLNKVTAAEFLTAVQQKIRQAEPAALFEEKTTVAKAKHIAVTAGKIATGLFCAGAALPIGIQNGYDGIKILTFDKSDSVSTAGKILIGLVPGIANAVFYFVSGFESLASAEDMYLSIKKSRKNIAKVLVMIGLNGLTASGYFIIGKSIVTETNILGLTPSTNLGANFPGIFSGAVFVTGMNNTDTMFGHSDAKVKDIDDLLYLLRRNGLDKSQISALRSNALLRAVPSSAEHKVPSIALTPLKQV